MEGIAPSARIFCPEERPMLWRLVFFPACRDASLETGLAFSFPRRADPPMGQSADPGPGQYDTDRRGLSLWTKHRERCTSS